MGNFWVFVAVLLVLLGFPLGSVAMLLAGALVLVLAVVSKSWARYSLSRVEYSHSLSSHRAFAGEEVQLVTQLTNRKFLPMPWVQVNDELPREVTPLQGRTITAPDMVRITLTNLLSMGWYHRITRKYTLRCEHRGHFYIGPTRIRSGDLFGMFTREMHIERDQTLTVYPKVLPLVSSRLPSHEPYGDIRIRRSLIHDPTRPVGSREYVVGDSLRHIHWKSTARTGILQTRVFDASTTSNFVLFFGVRTVEHPLQGSRPQLLELGVLTTTALANYALERGHPVGVYVNQNVPFTSHLMQAHPASHPEQLTRILEVMAKVHPEESIPLSGLVPERTRNLPWGTTIVVVTAVADDATLTALTRLRRSGWGVSLVQIGGGRTGSELSRIPTYGVSAAVDWRELQDIALQ